MRPAAPSGSDPKTAKPAVPLLPGLLAATLLAGALRLAWLESIPASLYCDEAFHGYEAWSILTTARDSRGVLLPFFFDIFGKGWEEPLYIYLTVPWVALFGPTAAAARCVAALAGTLAVLFTGLMAAALARPAGEDLARRAALGAAFMMAVSPWSLHLSRVAFQASLLPAALAAGFWLLGSALAQDARPSGRPGARLAAGAAALGLSLYTYTASRLAMPLLLGGFVLLHLRPLRALRGAAASALVLVLMALPIAGFSLTGQGRQRFSDVSLLSSPQVREGGIPAALPAALSNYLSYYSPSFLLTEGDPNPRHSFPGHGILHPHDVLLLGLGAAGVLFARRLRAPSTLFLLWWLAAFPVAASLTIDPGHAVRAICGQPGVYALAGLGAAAACARAGAAFGRKGAAAAAALLVVSGGAFGAVWLHGYATRYPIVSAPAFQYGLQEAYDYVESVQQDHDSVYVTRNEDFPFIHLLYGGRFPPDQYQAHRLTRTKYLFDEEVFYRGDRIPGRSNPIFVLKPYEVPAGVTPRRVVRYPDGTEAFVIAW